MSMAEAQVQCRIIAQKVVPDGDGNMVPVGDPQIGEWEEQHGEQAEFWRQKLISQGIQPPGAANKEGEELNGDSNS